MNCLSDGYSGAKRRRFTFSRLNESLGNVNLNTLEVEIGIPESKAVASCPTHARLDFVVGLAKTPKLSTITMGILTDRI